MVLATAWPQRELSKPERDLWRHDLAPLVFGDAVVAVRQCRRRCDWLPTWRQFEEEYREALGRRLDAERSQRALTEAPAEPMEPAVKLRCVAEVKRQLAGARGPLAADLRDVLDL